MDPRVTIRPERAGDATAIRSIHEASFPSAAEADLVDALRRSGHLSVSLVACDGEAVVGHIGFSPVSVLQGPPGLGLAPLAVTPAYRRHGVASRLVRDGLAECRVRAASWVVVLGDPAVYGSLGFTAASDFGLSDEYGGGPAFQVLELTEQGAPRGAGTVRYGPEFSAL